MQTAEGEIGYQPVPYQGQRDFGAMLGFLKQHKAARPKNAIMATIKGLFRMPLLFRFTPTDTPGCACLRARFCTYARCGCWRAWTHVAPCADTRGARTQTQMVYRLSTEVVVVVGGAERQWDGKRAIWCID